MAITTQAIRRATTYDEWKRAAMDDDERSGAATWRATEASSRYDYKVIRRRLEELKALMDESDPHELLFYLNEGIHGNMGRMGSSSLYRKARFGTKQLVTDYIRALADALTRLADADESIIPFHEKIDFFSRASHCFGRSALMLSGAGSLGPFHLGVIKALLGEGLLPNVISGASAGSFVAATVGTHTDEELTALLATDISFGSAHASGRTDEQLKIEEVREFVAELIPDMTFEEAFEHTGRRVNVSVSPSELHQTSRLLNAVTSPNVFIREAVLASCAIPGVFPPVTLAARNAAGERQPYIPARKWVDGSIAEDLPVRRLTRLYGVNHFITSQTNPVVLWTLREKDDSIQSRLWSAWQSANKEWAKATFPFAMQLTRDIYPLNLWTRMGYSVAMQDYTADVNIIPSQRFPDPRKLLAQLSTEETAALIHDGEAATWPKVEMIRNCTLIARTLDSIIVRLEARYPKVFPHSI